MSVSRAFFLPWGQRGRRAKPAAPRVFLAVEVLEDRTTPAAMSVGSSGATIGLGGSALAGALQASSQAHGTVQGGQTLQALLREASQSLSSLSRTLNSVAVQVNRLANGTAGNLQLQISTLLTQLQGRLTATAITLNTVANGLSALGPSRVAQEARPVANSLRGFARSLGTVSVAVNVLAGSLPTSVGPLTVPPGGVPNSTLTLFGGLLTTVSGDAGALSRALNVRAAASPVTSAQVVNAVLVGVNASLRNVSVSLGASSNTLSGALATVTGNGSPLLVPTGSTPSPLLTSGSQILGSTLGAVQNSLNALAGILPLAARVSRGSARSLLPPALTGVAANLGAVSGSLGAIGGQFSGTLATSLGNVFPVGGVSGGSLGSTSLVVGTLFIDVSGSLGTLASSLDTLGRSLTALTPAALGRESNLLRSAAADVGLLAQELVIAGPLLGLTNGFSTTAGQANRVQGVLALFRAVTQNLDLVSANLLQLANGT